MAVASHRGALSRLGAVARVVDAPPRGWDTLLAEDLNATPAHRPELWCLLAQTFGGMRPAFIAVESGGTMIGGAPLMVERRSGHHWIHALPFLLSGAPLARAGAHAEVDAACGAALARVQGELSAVGGEWSFYRPAGPEPDAAALGAPAGETRVLETSILDLAGGVEAAWSRVDAATRYELRRARRRELVVAEEPDALEETYALHLAQARGWPGYRPLPLELLRRLLATVGAVGGRDAPLARLHTARDGHGLVSAMFFLDHPREMFGWWTCTRGGSRAQHAMPHLVWTVAERAHAEGRTRVNLGGSVGRATLASFKQALGAQPCRYPVRWLDPGGGRSLGRLLAMLQRRVRRGRYRGETV